MKSEFVLLGKSSFALAVITDILKNNFKVSSLVIVSNIDDMHNESLDYEYKLKDVIYHEYSHDIYKPDKQSKYIIASIGKSRRKIFEFFRDLYGLETIEFADVIHHSALLSSEVKWGAGLHISPMSQIAPFTNLGNFVVINRNVSIGHHNIIEDFVTINPGVNIAGCCTIKENAIIGIGSSILDKVTIGKNTIIGAGSVVTKDIPDNVIAYGSPARIVRDNT